MDARPVLGVSALRPPFLDDVPAAQPRQSQAGARDTIVTNSDNARCHFTIRFRLDDENEIDDDDDYDDDDDEDIDDDEDTEDDDDENDDDDEDVETWQVSGSGASR